MTKEKLVSQKTKKLRLEVDEGLLKQFRSFAQQHGCSLDEALVILWNQMVEFNNVKQNLLTFNELNLRIASLEQEVEEFKAEGIVKDINGEVIGARG